MCVCACARLIDHSIDFILFVETFEGETEASLKLTFKFSGVFMYWRDKIFFNLFCLLCIPTFHVEFSQYSETINRAGNTQKRQTV